jgi:hypothetical protein
MERTDEEKLKIEKALLELRYASTDYYNRQSNNTHDRLIAAYNAIYDLFGGMEDYKRHIVPDEFRSTIADADIFVHKNTGKQYTQYKFDCMDGSDNAKVTLKIGAHFDRHSAEEEQAFAFLDEAEFTLLDIYKNFDLYKLTKLN